MRRTSIRNRLLRGVVATSLAAGTLAACSTDTAGVTAPAASGALAGSESGALDAAIDSVLEVASSLTRATALTRKVPLSGTLAAAAVITPERGGVLELHDAGLTVTVPPSAVSAPMVIWVSARPGKLVAYEFGPHGTQFNVPIRVKQDLKPTSWYRLVDRSQVEAGYFKDASQIDATTGTAMIDEFLPIELTQAASRLEFDVSHFSGYLLSTGKTCRTCTY